MSSLAKAPHERPRDCFSFASDLRRMLRDAESAPNSVTAINVLTSAAPNTIAADPLAGTASSAPSGPTSGARTDVGMIPPSDLAQAGQLPPTVRHGASRSGVAAPSAHGPTALGVASTLLSERGGEAGRAIAAAARAGAGSGSKPNVDRAAETRASSGFGSTQRLAMNGTAIDDGPVFAPHDDAVRAALAQREPLVVPPTSGVPHDAANQEIVFPRGHGFSTGSGGTGPVSGEARTRPPERGVLLPLVAAAVFAVLLVGGAALLVTKPWAKRPIVVAAPPPAASPAEPTTIAVEAATTVASVASPNGPVLQPVAPMAAAAAAATTPPAMPRPASAVSTRTAPTSPPAKPARPAAGSGPRPEDVGFE